MNTPNHTPGPWHVEKRYSGTMRDGKLVRYFAVAHTSPTRDCFVALDVAPAELMNGATGVTSPNLEGEANARLIAAAPDLLEALEKIATQADLTARTFPNAPRRGDWLRVGEIARKAIAKAEGRT